MAHSSPPSAEVAVGWLYRLGFGLLIVIDTFRHHLRYVRALWWTAYPLVYAGYSLLRGPLIDWYPYGFLNPNEGGWMNVVLYVVLYVIGIAVGFLVVSWVVVRFSNWRLAHMAG